jgi:hypothetical protein
MNAFATFGAVWCLTFSLGPVPLAGNQDVTSPDSTEKLREVVALLRIVWGKDFESNYPNFLLGPTPKVVLIPRKEMIRIAEARLDGRQRDGSTTQGLTIGEPPNVKIVVVYDDIAPLFVARSIIHEIGHLELRGKRLSRNREEAYVRKIVDTDFFEKAFGRQWLKTTVAALRKKVEARKKNGRQYQGYTTEAVEVFYQSLEKAGTSIARTPLHDGIIATLVFILTNSERDLLAALDADDVP